MIDQGMKVCGTVKGSDDNLQYLAGEIDLFHLDLTNRDQVHNLISKVRPDYVFHLAAQSLIGPSWEDPERTFKINILGTFYLLDAIKSAGIDPVIEIVGSSAEYGVNFPDEVPVRESKEFRPSSPYGVSKVGEDMLGYLYYQTFGMRTIRIRPFYITGPGKTGDVCSDFARGIIAIERGQQEALSVGNLETVRDLMDVSDAVEAMWVLAQRGKYGEVYNLCSGEGISIREILEKLVALSSTEIKIIQNSDKMRPSDDPLLIGDNSKLRQIGWNPQAPMEKTLSDILNFWRKG